MSFCTWGSHRGLPRKFADCVCVIINKRLKTNFYVLGYRLSTRYDQRDLLYSPLWLLNHYPSPPLLPPQKRHNPHPAFTMGYANLNANKHNMKTAPVFHAMGDSRYVTVRTERWQARKCRRETTAGQKRQNCVLSGVDNSNNKKERKKETCWVNDTEGYGSGFFWLICSLFAIWGRAGGGGRRVAIRVRSILLEMGVCSLIKWTA